VANREPVHGRLGFFGLPLGALTLLGEGHELAFAVLSPVPHVGRRRLIAKIGKARVIEVAECLGDFEAVVEARLNESPIDLLVSWFWTRRIPPTWISKARLGAIGVHPSLLPKHRGPNPFFGAIDAGDTLTGVTAHELTAEYDTGRILLQSSLPVGDRDAWQLARALDRPSLSALKQATLSVLQGTLEAHEQDPRLATWAPEPTGDALRVDWNWPTERILRRIRALGPTPGLALELKQQAFFVMKASRVARPNLELRAGEAVIWGEPKEVVIATVDGAIRLDACVLSVRGAGEGDGGDGGDGGDEGDEVGELLHGPAFARQLGPL